MKRKKKVYKRPVSEQPSVVKSNKEALLNFVAQNVQDSVGSDDYDGDHGNEFSADEFDQQDDEFNDETENFSKNLEELINNIVKKSVDKHAKKRLLSRSVREKNNLRRFLPSSSGVRKPSKMQDRDEDQYNKQVLDAALAIMKRQQHEKRTVSNRPPVVEANEEVFLNFVNQNTQNHFGRNKFGLDRQIEFSSNDFDKPADEMEDVSNVRTAGNSIYDRVKGKRRKGGKVTEQSSRILRSSTSKTHNGKNMVDQDTLCCNQPKLDAALEVIQKVMKMDAAKPFNAPVDPVALDIPDYFDIIETPMDFGTICNNIQNAIKYRNSGDVFKDVQLIWDNCSKYNNKGAMVLELMKRVKKSFIKYWTEAGLYIEQATETFVLATKKSGTLQAHSSQPHALPQPNTQSPQFQMPSTVNAMPKSAAQSHINASTPPAAPLSQLHPASLQPAIEIVDQRDVRKKRGKRGATKLAEVWNLPPWKRIAVEFGRLGEPVGPNAGLLAKFLGTVARKGDLAPLHYKDWRGMPQTLKEDMWRIVEEKFDIHPSFKNWVLKSLGTKWRSFKCTLKAKVYDIYPTYEVMCANLPCEVDKNQFSALVNFWDSETGKKLSEQNKKLRRDQTTTHTAGTKSFARIVAEKESNNGVQPSRAELYILTHRHKDGTAVDEEAREKIEKLEELISQPPESPQPLDRKIDWENDIFCQVFPQEKRRRLRGFELGLAHSNLVTSGQYNDEMRCLQEEVKTLQEKITQLQTQADRVAVLEAEVAKIPELEVQLSKMFSLMQRIFPEEQLTMDFQVQ